MAIHQIELTKIHKIRFFICIGAAAGFLLGIFFQAVHIHGLSSSIHNLWKFLPIAVMIVLVFGFAIPIGVYFCFCFTRIHNAINGFCKPIFKAVGAFYAFIVGGENPWTDVLLNDPRPWIMAAGDSIVQNALMMWIGETLLYCYCFSSYELDIKVVFMFTLILGNVLSMVKFFSSRDLMLHTAKKASIFIMVAFYQNLVHQKVENDKFNRMWCLLGGFGVCFIYALDRGEKMHEYMNFNAQGWMWNPTIEVKVEDEANTGN